MTVLSEMERTSDWGFIKDSTSYTRTGAWGTLHDWGNIVMGSDGIVCFAVTYGKLTGGYGNIRIKIGSNIVFGGEVVGGVASVTKLGYIWLPAGTYDVLAEGKSSDGANVQLSFFAFGSVTFNDTKYSALQSGGAAPITVNLAKVVARQTPAGVISRQHVFVQVHAYQSDNGATEFIDSGSATNSIKIEVDGVQVAWTYKYNDTHCVGSAFGTLILSEALADHTIVITPSDTTNTVMTVAVVSSPWILSPWMLQSFPVTLSFSQFSTLYVWMEPLVLNPTKNLNVGSPYRAVDYSANYYYSSSGVGLVQAVYTFDALQLSLVGVYVDGYGGCISVVAVDIR